MPQRNDPSEKLNQMRSSVLIFSMRLILVRVAVDLWPILEKCVQCWNRDVSQTQSTIHTHTHTFTI